MKPVIQTVTEAGKGNCLAACIASILEVPIGEIPDLACGANSRSMHDYLATKGAVPIWIWPKNLGTSWVGYWGGPCIVVGPSPRLPCDHAVVAEPDGYGYRVVHDPHPEGGGLAGPIKSVLYFGAQLPPSNRGDGPCKRT